MALPAFGMRLQDAAQIREPAARRLGGGRRGRPDAAGVPRRGHARRVVVVPDDSAGEVRAAVDALHERAARSDGALREPITTAPVGGALVVRVPLAGAGTDAESGRALEFLRERALPATVGAVKGVEVAVAGRTAMPYDFTRQVTARTPLVFAFVLVLAFVLLAVAFRSLAIPLVSIALNLLSIGAAYGVLVGSSRDGRLESVLGFNAYGGVVSWLPLFMFVILFGLSMDYHIFILSRIRERWSGSRAAARRPPRGDRRRHRGQRGGRDQRRRHHDRRLLGLHDTVRDRVQDARRGMAVAILIDATVVRGVLLPAALALLGRSRSLENGRRPVRGNGDGTVSERLSGSESCFQDCCSAACPNGVGHAGRPLSLRCRRTGSCPWSGKAGRAGFLTPRVSGRAWAVRCPTRSLWSCGGGAVRRRIGCPRARRPIAMLAASCREILRSVWSAVSASAGRPTGWCRRGRPRRSRCPARRPWRTSRALSFAVGKREIRRRKRLLRPCFSRHVPSLKSRSSMAIAAAPVARVWCSSRVRACRICASRCWRCRSGRRRSGVVHRPGCRAHPDARRRGGRRSCPPRPPPAPGPPPSGRTGAGARCQEAVTYQRSRAGSWWMR